VCIPRRRIAAHSGTWTANNNNNNNIAKPKGGGGRVRGVTWIFKVVPIGKLVEFFLKIPPLPSPLFFHFYFIFPNATCLCGAILFDKIVSIFVAFVVSQLKQLLKEKRKK
jgi:hypothetical protein